MNQKMKKDGVPNFHESYYCKDDYTYWDYTQEKGKIDSHWCNVINMQNEMRARSHWLNSYATFTNSAQFAANRHWFNPSFKRTCSCNIYAKRIFRDLAHDKLHICYIGNIIEKVETGLRHQISCQNCKSAPTCWDKFKNVTRVLSLSLYLCPVFLSLQHNGCTQVTVSNSPLLSLVDRKKSTQFNICISIVLLLSKRKNKISLSTKILEIIEEHRLDTMRWKHF